ncbi:MAG: hypothetical protein KDB80_11935 [Planctomycetes bacterium]|nr:hypothetical protein [Planctomycetota bacterium]
MPRRDVMDAPDEPTLAFDPSTGRPILVAPQRRHRPLHTHGRASGPCPFCPGEEHQTPSEVDAVRAAGDRNEPGWRVRAFPNLYPASHWHEVIVEGAEHETRPHRVPPAIWLDALDVYRRRISAMEAQRDVQCAFLFKNVGREAGASIEHNHTQLLGLTLLPPRLELELRASRGACPWCAEVESAPTEGRALFVGEHHVVLCPRYPKLPHELWLVPRRHDTNFLVQGPAASEELSTLLPRLFGAVDAALDGAAFNVFLHRIPGEDFHWHFELQPRTGYLAGLELGGDMYINSISSRESADLLRPHF